MKNTPTHLRFLLIFMDILVRKDPWIPMDNHGTDIHGYPCTISVVIRGYPYFMDIRER